MKKGFIGPLGDDLPSIIAILLALTVFFSGIVYTLNVYNQKIDDMQALKGSVDIAKAILDKGILSGTDQANIDPEEARYVARSYGLKHGVYLDEDTNGVCPPDTYRFSYLVAAYTGAGATGADVGLHTLVLCTWRE